MSPGALLCCCVLLPPHRYTEVEEQMAEHWLDLEVDSTFRKHDVDKDEQLALWELKDAHDEIWCARALARVPLLARVRQLVPPVEVLALALPPVLPQALGQPTNRRQTYKWASPP